MKRNNSIALCCIGRMENLYAREFVEHHIGVGFDKIIIADNNHDGEEHFEDVLQDHIDTGHVRIEDFRNLENAQRTAYNMLYSKYGSSFSWLAFFDFDEFLFVEGGRNIKDLLFSCPSSFDCMMFPWMMMSDSGLVRYDSRPLVERFTKKAADYNLGKSIVRGGISGLAFTGSVHVPYKPVLHCCTPSYRPTRQHRTQPNDYSVAYLKHFSTKTIEEWLTNKCKKGTAGRSFERFKEHYKDYFFTINERTEEKEQFITDFNNRKI